MDHSNYAIDEMISAKSIAARVEALAKEIEDGAVQVFIQDERIVVKVVTDQTVHSDSSIVQQEQLEIYLKVAESQNDIKVAVKVEQEAEINSSDSQIWEAMFSAQYRRIRSTLAPQIENNTVEVIREGDKIIVRLASKGSFKSGAAELQPGFSDLLNSVGEAVQSAEGLITIEGHTDNMKVTNLGQIKDNWDLSVMRATSIVKILTNNKGLNALKEKLKNLKGKNNNDGDDDLVIRY